MTELELRQFLFALATLLVAGHFTGYLFNRFRLPRVIGEITGGIIVGPTVLGALFPDLKDWIFNGFHNETELLSSFYWIGLILLMFISGFSMEKRADPADRKLFIALTVATTTIPFAAGLLLTYAIDFGPYMGSANNAVAMSLVVGIAMAITSIPVISRIFIDLNIEKSRFARVVISTAVAHDIILWAVLAVATGIAGASSLSTGTISLIVIKTLLFFSLSTFGGPWLLRAFTRNRFNLVKKGSPIGWMLVVCFLMVGLANLLEVNVIFGAFVAGLLFGSTDDGEIDRARSRITDFAMAFFIPFYFAMVGFKINLITEFHFWWTLGFILICSAIQLSATAFCAKFMGQTWEAAFNLGLAINTRGGPGIVLATVALEHGIINGTFYTTIVLLSVFTPIAAGSWFRYRMSHGWQP